MSRMNCCCLFLSLVVIVGCENQPNPNSGFPPIAKSEPLPESQTASSGHVHSSTDGHDHSSHSGKPKSAGKAEPGSVDADAPEEFTTTSSGLKYRIRRKSDGKMPTIKDSVEVHYKGWLDDGKQFDSSYDRGETTSFPLKNVIKGWTEGMQLVGEGGMVELEIPYQLGYGETGTTGIPPKSTLHFLVELVKVK